MAQFYSNENFPLPVVEELRNLGHDVLTIQEAGRASQSVPDAEVLRFATDAERALITLNRRHFIRLHGELPDHHGIIVCTYDPDFPGQAQRIDAAVRGVENLAGQLLRVGRSGSSASR